MKLQKHGVGYVQGGLGGGKSLLCVQYIRQALLDGKRVATNLDLFVDNMLPPRMKDMSLTRLPDKPDIDDLEAIGYGYDIEGPHDYNEKKFGLIVLDELGTWFNSREWNDKGRRKIINWLLHARKKRWSLLLIIQDIELLDNQARAATAKQYLYMCQNMGAYAIPIFSPIFKFFFRRPLTLPNMHKASIYVGTGQNKVKHDTVFYKAEELYSAYHTTQEFIERDNKEAKMICSMLSPWHLKGRYLPPPKDKQYYRNLITSRIEYVVYAMAASFFISFSSIAYALLQKPQKVVERIIIKDRETEALPTNNKDQKKTDDSIQEVQIAGTDTQQESNCDVIENQYRDAFINGSVQHPKGWTYLINYDGMQFTSTYLSEQMGLVTLSKGRCHAKVIIDGCPIELTCFSPSRSHIARVARGYEAVNVAENEQ